MKVCLNVDGGQRAVGGNAEECYRGEPEERSTKRRRLLRRVSPEKLLQDNGDNVGSNVVVGERSEKSSGGELQRCFPRHSRRLRQVCREQILEDIGLDDGDEETSDDDIEKKVDREQNNSMERVLDVCSMAFGVPMLLMMTNLLVGLHWGRNN